MTRLVTVAHGTRKAPGNEVARADAPRRRASGSRWRSVGSYVELCEPLFEDVLAASDDPTVVVPLLLSTGFHVRQDLPGGLPGPAGRAAGAPARPAPRCSPAPARAAARAGAAPGAGRLVMVAAGSSDPLATRDLDRAAELLAGPGATRSRRHALRARPPPGEVVRPGDVVSPYLLSPGFFADRARDESGPPAPGRPT